MSNVRNDRMEFEREIQILKSRVSKLENQSKSYKIVIDHQRLKLNDSLRIAEKHKTLEAIDILNGGNKMVNYLLFQKTYREIEDESRREGKKRPISLKAPDVVDKLINELGKPNSHALMAFADHI